MFVSLRRTRIPGRTQSTFGGQATSVDGHRRHGGFALGEYILLEDFKTVQGFRTRREALLASSGR